MNNEIDRTQRLWTPETLYSNTILLRSYFHLKEVALANCLPFFCQVMAFVNFSSKCKMSINILRCLSGRSLTHMVPKSDFIIGVIGFAIAMIVTFIALRRSATRPQSVFVNIREVWRWKSWRQRSRWRGCSTCQWLAFEAVGSAINC